MSEKLKTRTVSRLKMLKRIIVMDIICKDKDIMLTVIDAMLLELEE